MSIEIKELEELKQEYLSQLRGIFPLYRAALLFVALVVVALTKTSTQPNASARIVELEMRHILDFDGGLLSSTTVRDVLVAIAMLVVGIFVQRALRLSLFAWVKKHLSLETVAKNMRDQSAHSRTGNVASYFALKKAEADAKLWGRRVGSMALASEAAATLCLIFLYAAWILGGLLDVGVAIVFLVCGGLALAQSFLLFLRRYLPHAMHHKGLAGVHGDLKLP